ncbi:YbaB/EbfC family nucleoid-associated protein [Frankia sp. CcWB2]
MSNPQDRAGSGASAGGGALGQLFEQAQKMQAAILATQEDLATARVDGTAGGGLVRATVNGGGELVDLTISPEAVDPEDTETLPDLILAAVRNATTNAHKLAADRLGAITGGLGAGGPAGPGGAGGLGGLGSLLSGGGLGGPLPGGPGLPGLD